MQEYEIIKKFAQDLSHTGIHCYIAVRKQHLYAIDRYVSKRCNHKTQLQLKELKSLAWKDVDEKWFNELINKKEEKLLQNIERNNSMNSSSSSSSSNNDNNQISMDIDTVDTVDIVDDGDDDDDDDGGDDDDDDDDDTLDKTIICDDTLHSYF